MDDADLLSRIRNNPESFSELFKLYYHPIFGYILRRTGNFDDTADIAADTFLKAFRHICHFNYTGVPVKVWLYRIATNEVHTLYVNVIDRSGLISRPISFYYLLHSKE